MADTVTPNQEASRGTMWNERGSCGITPVTRAMKAYSAKKLFNGEDWLEDVVVVVDTATNQIREIVPSKEWASPADSTAFYICPPFLEFQIYGANAQLFSAQPTIEAAVESLKSLHLHCLATGATDFVITIATNTKEIILRSIDAVRAYWNQGGKGCIGLHLEGPWINPKKKGAHIFELVQPNPTIQDIKQILDYGDGVVKVVTVAPEVCSIEAIKEIKSRGIIISAGHSDATYQVATESFDNGITTVTHLFNAMSPFSHRSPGLVGAAFDHSSVYASIIPDGYHVDFPAVRIAKKCMGPRLFVITDMVTESHTGPYQHYLNGDKYECDGVLSGSALNLLQAVTNLVEKVGIELDEAFRMVSLYPASVLGSKELGRIKVGSKAKLLLLTENLKLVLTVD